MESTINHPNLGLCKVLLETTLNNGKCFKFIESWKLKSVKSSWKSWRMEVDEKWIDVRYDSRYRSNKPKPHYYVLWGNSHDIENMGLTKITTPKGTNVRSFSSASKKFFELIKATENMTFKK